MPFNTNFINKIRYTIYTPVYDYLAQVLQHSRQQSIESLQLTTGTSVLLVGGGTGLDLPLLPKGVRVTATDLTPSMVQKMKKRSQRLGIHPQLLVMDGQQLTFADNSFDVVILHLILAVIPDPVAAIKEAERVVKHGGTIAVLDKFLPKTQTAGPLRILLNQFTKLLFSDINRKIEELVSHTSLAVVADKPANFGGIFRRILLQKPPLDPPL